MTTPEAAFQEQRMIQLTLQMPENPAVSFDTLKAEFLGPLKKYVQSTGVGDLSFEYQTDEMIGVSLEIKNESPMNIDFYLDGSVAPDAGVQVDSRDWIAGARKIIETVAGAVEKAKAATGQYAKLKKAIDAMSAVLSAKD